MNTGVHVSFQTSVFIVFVLYLGVELLDNIVVLFLVCFFFFRKPHTVFYSGHTNLHSQQPHTRVPFSPHHHQYLLAAVLLRTAILTDVS